MTPEAGQTGFGRQTRRMLRRLRNVMAYFTPDQHRLDLIVRIVPAEMATAVCSLYVRRADNRLELCATEGLNPEAVHHTRLRAGWRYRRQRPATGAFRRPVGPEIRVPSGNRREVLSVVDGRSGPAGGTPSRCLVIQNRPRRHYGDEEIETLETFAMALADLLSAGTLADNGQDHVRLAPARLAGLSIVSGLAVGHAHIHCRRMPITWTVAENPEAELARLEAGDDA